MNAHTRQFFPYSTDFNEDEKCERASDIALMPSTFLPLTLFPCVSLGKSKNEFFMLINYPLRKSFAFNTMLAVGARRCAYDRTKNDARHQIDFNTK